MVVSGAEGSAVSGPEPNAGHRSRCAAWLRAHDTRERSCAGARRAAHGRPALRARGARRKPAGAGSIDTPKTAQVANSHGIELEAGGERRSPEPGTRAAEQPRFAGDNPSRSCCSPNPIRKAGPRRRRRRPTGFRRTRASRAARPMRRRPTRKDLPHTWDSWCLATDNSKLPEQRAHSRRSPPDRGVRPAPGPPLAGEAWEVLLGSSGAQPAAPRRRAADRK
jgi:hypothetical protein